MKNYVYRVTLTGIMLGALGSYGYAAEDEVQVEVCDTKDIFNTKDKALSKVTVTDKEWQRLTEFLDTYGVSEEDTEDLDHDRDNIGMIQMKEHKLEFLFDEKAEGTIGTNLGLKLCNPNRFGAELLGLWKFNHELVDTVIYDYNYDYLGGARLGVSYLGNITQMDAFDFEAVKGKVEVPKFVNLESATRGGAEWHQLVLDFVNGTDYGETTYQISLHDFPLTKMTINLLEDDQEPYLQKSYNIFSYENEIKEPNEDLYSIWISSDYDDDKKYKAGDQIELTYWFKAGGEDVEEVTSTLVTLEKGNKKEKEQDKEDGLLDEEELIDDVEEDESDTIDTPTKKVAPPVQKEGFFKRLWHKISSLWR